MIKDQSLRLAIKNISEFGDTDVFPSPLEKHWFADDPDAVFQLLAKIRDDFEGAFKWLPIASSTELTNVGHFGFRSATQIEPLWNAFFLAATIDLAEVVEPMRLPNDQVFSYRFSPNSETGKLFSKCGWRHFHKKGIEKAKLSKFVGIVDISDFYPRIYHHRLENALLSNCKCNPQIVKPVDQLLRKLNPGNSFGLPVGGPASRILAEALLTRTDRLLEVRRIDFIRFVDDYIIFAHSEDQVRTAILDMSRILLDNEGLSLNRNKIRIYEGTWHIQQSVFADSKDMSEEMKEKRAYFSEFVRFDPYSETAEEDYESMKKAVTKYDVLGMLFSELDRRPIDIYAVRQLIKSLKFMNKRQISDAFKKLSVYLKHLSPVFSTLARTFCQLRDHMEVSAALVFFSAVRSLVESRQPLIGASGTMAFAIQVLSLDPDNSAESALQSLFDLPDRTPIIEREIISAMARRAANPWISNLRNRFNGLSTPWSKRALLAASYSLGDEGREWRKRIKKDLQEHDIIFLEWLGTKNNGTVWCAPI